MCQSTHLEASDQGRRAHDVMGELADDSLFYTLKRDWEGK